jgi:hypothetical protein
MTFIDSSLPIMLWLPAITTSDGIHQRGWFETETKRKKIRLEIHFLLRINGGDLGVSVALKVYPSSQNYKQSNSLNCETPPPPLHNFENFFSQPSLGCDCLDTRNGKRWKIIVA